jgi:hypothetical protein
MALDDVPRLDVIGQDHDVIPRGAARLLNLGDRPLAVLNARPERQARSVGAVEEVPVPDPGRDLDLLASPTAPGLRHTVYPPGVLRQAKQRSIFPRSNPTTTSLSITVTGVAW